MTQTSSETLAYLAGILDGEGSFSISRRKPDTRSKNWRYIGCVNCHMTQPEAIELLHETFGGYILWKRGNKNCPNAKPLLQWRVHSRLAASTIRTLLPFLRVKQTVAKALLDYFDHVHNSPKVGRGNPLTEQELVWRAAQTELIRSLNTRRYK